MRVLMGNTGDTTWKQLSRGEEWLGRKFRTLRDAGGSFARGGKNQRLFGR